MRSGTQGTVLCVSCVTHISDVVIHLEIRSRLMMKMNSVTKIRSHKRTDFCLELLTGIEPVTSSLPRTRSTN